jgi:hypothetical protein
VDPPEQDFQSTKLQGRAHPEQGKLPRKEANRYIKPTSSKQTAVTHTYQNCSACTPMIMKMVAITRFRMKRNHNLVPKNARRS